MVYYTSQFLTIAEAFTTYIPIANVYRHGNVCYVRFFDLIGKYQAERHAVAETLSTPYHKFNDYDLVILEQSDPAPRTIDIQAGYVKDKTGFKYISYFSSDSDTMYQVYGPNWTPSAVTVYSDSAYGYDSLGEADSGVYLVRHFWRLVGDSKVVYCTLGATYYETIADAVNDRQPETLPYFITKRCIYLGFIVIEAHTNNSITFNVHPSGIVQVARPIKIQQGTPTSSSYTGSEGTLVYDSNYLYVCTATDTWKRTALETW